MAIIPFVTKAQRAATKRIADTLRKEAGVKPFKTKRQKQMTQVFNSPPSIKDTVNKRQAKKNAKKIRGKGIRGKGQK